MVSDIMVVMTLVSQKVKQVLQHSQITNSIDVEVFNNHDRPPRRFAPGRHCAEPGCVTQLSIYNGSDYCSLHAVKVAPRVRGRRTKQKA